jgi:pSer/pThr/pTyr-binding forkhead associated (FHA) protein
VKVLRNQYDGPAYYHTWGTECLVGRTQGQHRFNRDTSMSGKHAALVLKDGRVYLEDRKSTNGTFVRIKEPWVLERGDAVKIGEQVLEVLA